MACRCRSVRVSSAARTRPTLSDVSAASPAGSWATVGSRTATSGCAGAMPLRSGPGRRRRWVIARIQESADPAPDRSGACRHTSTMTSWATSSACAGSRTPCEPIRTPVSPLRRTTRRRRRGPRFLRARAGGSEWVRAPQPRSSCSTSLNLGSVALRCQDRGPCCLLIMRQLFVAVDRADGSRGVGGHRYTAMGTPAAGGHTPDPGSRASTSGAAVYQGQAQQ